MRNLIFLLIARAIFQGIAHAIAPALPFFLERESHDVLEYLTHSTMMRLHWFEAYVPFTYPVIWFINQLFPSVSPLLLVKALILLVDCVTGIIWYAIVEHLKAIGFLNRNRLKECERLSNSFVITALYLLNPFAILYNEACNSDGVKYFWVALTVFSALKRFGYRNDDILKYVMFLFAACGMLQNNSLSFSVVLMPLCYLISYCNMNLERGTAVSTRALKTIIFHTLPHILLALSIYLLYIICGDVSKVHHILGMEYKGKGSGIDYSIYWYLYRVVPSVFEIGNLFKTHFLIYILPFPLLIVMRHRPLEYLFTMLNIAILQQPRLSILGLWFMVCVFAVHYPQMDKTLAFTKMMIVIFAAMILSLVAYIAWVGRYFANPNHFFAPQMIIFIIMCMIMEDFSTVTFVWTTEKEIEEDKRRLEAEKEAKKGCGCSH